MGVSLTHFLALVPHPRIDDSLVEAAGGTVGRETVSQAVPAFDLAPFALGQRQLKVCMGLVPGNRRAFSRVECGSAGPAGEPFLERLDQQRRHGHRSRAVVASFTFPLADRDDLGFEVDVLRTAADQLTAAGSGVASSQQHRIHVGFVGMLLGVCEQFSDLPGAQEQTIPQSFRLSVLDLTFDLVPRLKPPGFLGGRILQFFSGETAFDFLVAHGPRPESAQRVYFFADCDGADGVSVTVLLLPPAVDVILQLFEAE